MSTRPTVFASTPPPEPLAREVRARLRAEHAARPFCSADVRTSIHRARAALADLPLEVAIYRGGLGLTGVEVDHLWLGVRTEADAADDHGGAPAPRPAAQEDVGEARADAGSRARPGHAWVLDVAFPLFASEFVAVLRRYVAGDAERVELDRAAAPHGMEARVVGALPRGAHYHGQPVLHGLERVVVIRRGR